MNNKHTVIVFGAGVIGEAVSAILVEYSNIPPDILIGDINNDKAEKTAINLKNLSTKNCVIQPFKASIEGSSNSETIEALNTGEIIIDCLPGKQSVKLAKLALKYNLYYVNITEHEKEIKEIIHLAESSSKAFLLQTGLAPGFINIITNSLFNQFREKYLVDKIDNIVMRVGALPQFSSPPSHYGITWSSIGVANEYLSEATAIRDYKVVKLPSLSERSTRYIKGKLFEEDLTSGGAADLPNFYKGRVKNLDYKTLRFPGHYDWIFNEIRKINSSNKLIELNNIIEKNVPFVIEDFVIVYSAIESKDNHGKLRILEKSYEIFPKLVGNKFFSAIQIATAAPLAESVRYILESGRSGLIKQSDIPTEVFLNSKFVKSFYQSENSRESLFM